MEEPQWLLWDWPKKIDHELVERALKLSLFEERRKLILMGANGLGKTCIAKNIAYAAVAAGRSVIFRGGSEINKLRVRYRCEASWPSEIGYLEDCYRFGGSSLSTPRSTTAIAKTVLSIRI